MNTKEIGSYIANKRKAKNLTQRELGEMLSLTDKTISRWKNGNYMPDISYLIPLSEILDASVEELLCGRDIPDKKDNNGMIKDTVDCLSKQIRNERNTLNYFIIATGIMIIYICMTGNKNNLPWFSVLIFGGLCILCAGIYRILDKKTIGKLMISGLVFVAGLGLFMTYDYYSVKNNHSLPLFAYSVTVNDRTRTYETLFYRLYQINAGTDNEYSVFDGDKSIRDDELIVVPFNYDKAGYDSIIHYHSPYLGDNSNTANLISRLPLNEYASGIMIDSDNCIVHIDYQISMMYIDEYYLKQSLIHNSVSMFMMIDNLEGIEYSIVGKTFKVKREDISKYYSDYNKIDNRESFEEFLVKKLDDTVFINNLFDNLINE